MSGGAVRTSTRTPPSAAPLLARAAEVLSATTQTACPERPTFAATAASRAPLAQPICSMRSPIFTPVMLTMSGLRVAARREKKPMTFNDIVFRPCPILSKLLPRAANWVCCWSAWAPSARRPSPASSPFAKVSRKPIGSLTQMGTIRLGKRTDNRSPKISDVVPLATLDDLVFGGWDIFDDNCYEAAKHAGVLEDKLLEQVKDRARGDQADVRAVFDQSIREAARTVRTCKKAQEQEDLADQLDRRHPEVQGRQQLRSPRDGVVRQHRDLRGRSALPQVARGVRKRT